MNVPRVTAGGRKVNFLPLMGKSLGQPEVQDLHLTFGRHHDVFRLDIAMHNPVFLGSGEGLRTLDGNRQERFHLEWLTEARA